MRIISLFLLIALLSLTAGLLGEFLFTGESIVNPISVAVVDLDDSFETRMIVSAIMESVEEPDALLIFISHSAESASAALRDGYVSAIISLPENFGAAMISGENIPFSVTYNEARPLTSALVRTTAGAFADMLRTSQMGVYVTLNYALAQNLPRESYDMIFIGVNMRFLDFVLNRSDFFVIDARSVTGGLSIWQAYFIAAYVVLMMCAAFVMTDAMRRNLNRHFLLSVKLRGVSVKMTMMACLAAYFLLFLVINAGLWLLSTAVMVAIGLPPLEVSTELVLGLTIMTVSLAAFAVMLTFAFESAFTAGVFTAVFTGLSLFLSGGIVPVLYFSEGLGFVSNAMWSTWLTRLLAASILGESAVWPTIASLAFGLAFMSIGGMVACKRRVA